MSQPNSQMVDALLRSWQNLAGEMKVQNRKLDTIAEYIDKLVKKDTMIMRDIVFNTAVAAATNIFSPNIRSVNKPMTIFRIFFISSTAGIVNLQFIRGNSTEVAGMNSAAAVVADAGYTWDVPLPSDVEFNLQVSLAGTISCMILEIPAVISG